MNKRSEQAIVNALKNYPTPPIERQHLEDTARGAVEVLRQRQAGRRTSFGEFYLVQLRFISWKVWAVQLLIVLGMVLLLRNALQEMGESVQIVMMVSISAPLLVMAGIRTLTRSLSCHMLDIELSTRHLLEKLTMVRMSLLGMADLLGLTLLAAILSVWIHSDVATLLIYLLVPFNLTCLGCLWLLNRVRTPSCGYYCLTFAGMVALVQMILAFTPNLWVFEPAALGVWQTMLLVTTAGIALQVRGLRKTCRSLETASSLM
ncbi:MULTISPECIES: hypothetical protein [unclassified Paenibacillus]|uniref:hypothetical protein n=1 Tax=unclassified Paenibacillus TaxID=185978 RepID=UPI0030F8BB4D